MLACTYFPWVLFVLNRPGNTTYLFDARFVSGAARASCLRRDTFHERNRAQIFSVMRTRRGRVPLDRTPT